MQVWVDADACPKIIKEILFRAAIRTKTMLILVANQPLYHIPLSAFIKTIQVPSGFDGADNKIIDNIQPGDLVITADIPLADAVIHKNGLALNPRGQLYTQDNIKQILSFRNLSMDLRSAGVIKGGAPKFSKKEIQDFANALDKFLARPGAKNVR